MNASFWQWRMPELLCSPASPICPVKTVTLYSGLAAALIHTSMSYTDHVADWSQAQTSSVSSGQIQGGNAKEKDVGDTAGQLHTFLKRAHTFKAMWWKAKEHDISVSAVKMWYWFTCSLRIITSYINLLNSTASNVSFTLFIYLSGYKLFTFQRM